MASCTTRLAILFIVLSMLITKKTAAEDSQTGDSKLLSTLQSENDAKHNEWIRGNTKTSYITLCSIPNSEIKQ